jgi:hypothetical protein
MIPQTCREFGHWSFVKNTETEDMLNSESRSNAWNNDDSDNQRAPPCDNMSRIESLSEQDGLKMPRISLSCSSFSNNRALSTTKIQLRRNMAFRHVLAGCYQSLQRSTAIPRAKISRDCTCGIVVKSAKLAFSQPSNFR